MPRPHCVTQLLSAMLLTSFTAHRNRRNQSRLPTPPPTHHRRPAEARRPTRGWRSKRCKCRRDRKGEGGYRAGEESWQGVTTCTPICGYELMHEGLTFCANDTLERA